LVHAALIGDADPVNDLSSDRRTDAVDVLQRDDDALVRGDVNACDAGQTNLLTAPDSTKSATAPAASQGQTTIALLSRREWL
jgi:hypothetical protein